MISSVQQNCVALTALNQRERAHNAQLKSRVEQLTAELSRVNGTCMHAVLADQVSLPTKC